jgi:hypothetical protein
MGEWMYTSTFSSSRLKLEVSGHLHALAALSPGKERPGPSDQEVGWIPGPVWAIRRSENSWCCRDSNSNPSVVEPVVSRYKGGVTAVLWLMEGDLKEMREKGASEYYRSIFFILVGCILLRNDNVSEMLTNKVVYCDTVINNNTN